MAPQMRRTSGERQHTVASDSRQCLLKVAHGHSRSQRGPSARVPHGGRRRSRQEAQLEASPAARW